MQKELQHNLGKGQGHLKYIKSQVPKIYNTFDLITKVHIFLFVLTGSLNMILFYFLRFRCRSAKRAGVPQEGSGAF